MDLESILDFLDASELHTFIPISFPSSVKEPMTSVNITGGTVARGGVYQVHLRIVTRETHPSKAIKVMKDVRKYLYKNLKGTFFDGKKVLMVETDTPEPLVLGDENGMYDVSWNYTILEG